MLADWLAGAFFKGDRTARHVLALDRTIQHHPLNHPISLLEGDLCKTKVLKCFFDLRL